MTRLPLLTADLLLGAQPLPPGPPGPVRFALPGWQELPSSAPADEPLPRRP